MNVVTRDITQEECKYTYLRSLGIWRSCLKVQCYIVSIYKLFSRWLHFNEYFFNKSITQVIKNNLNNTYARRYLPHPFSFPFEIQFDVFIPLYSHCWSVPSWGNTQGPCLPRRVSLDIHLAALNGDQEIQKGYGRWMFCLIPRALK